MSAADAPNRPAADQLTFEVVAGKAVGTNLVVGERIVLGRHERDGADLGGDPELSRSHAEIIRGATGAYILADLSSSNGTYVNGERVQSPRTLALGDIVDIGTSRLVVRGLPTVAAPATTSDGDPRDETVFFRIPAAMRAPGAAALPAIELRLTIDVDKAEVRLGPAGEVDGSAVALRFVDGRWQLGSS